MSVVLYGATGYTGRLTAAELARREVPFTIAGRSADKLARLSADLGGVEHRQVSADDRAGLTALLGDATVVINCAGPFTLAGDLVPATAAVTGTHYLDSTGEQTFMQQVFERHHAAAERSGAALVPGMGFDYAPGDCLARIVGRVHEPLEEIVLAYAVEGFGMTRGTLRSGLEMLGGDMLCYRDGEWRPVPTGVLRAHFDFPPPLGRQPMSRYPAGEVVTVPRHTRVRNVTTMLTSATAAPDPRLAKLMPYTEPLLGAILKTPLRGVLDNAIGKLPEGPSEDRRRAARFTICAVARGEDGGISTGVVRGEDIYGLTAVILTEAAARMSAEGYDRAGALGPAAAFDPVSLLDSMRANRLTWDAPVATVAA